MKKKESGPSKKRIQKSKRVIEADSDADDF
jgi:hypothetical protein